MSMLDLYHYQLLSNYDEYDHNILESTWKEWKNLRKYEHEEKFHWMLYNSIKFLNIHIQLEREIRMEINELSREIEMFYLKWQKKDMKEIKLNKNWMIWKKINKMIKYFFESIEYYRINCQYYKEYFEEKIYH